MEERVDSETEVVVVVGFGSIEGWCAIEAGERMRQEVLRKDEGWVEVLATVGRNGGYGGQEWTCNVLDTVRETVSASNQRLSSAVRRDRVTEETNTKIRYQNKEDTEEKIGSGASKKDRSGWAARG